MKILAVETSCDDTCIAILEIKDSRFKILSNIVSSQVKLHAKYGGVYPFLAKREHQKNLPTVLKKALKEAGSPKIDPVVEFGLFRQRRNKISEALSKFHYGVDLIAVTVGPGLEPCLWTGVNFAKESAKELNLPIAPINHIEAHILVNWFSPVGSNFQLPIFNSQTLFPAICLVVSGGHTQLILMKNIGDYKILGETRDDAAGECLDKVARILGLGYPGGPAIAELARQWKLKTQNSKLKIQLPRPMIYQKNYDFSFSGLKTAVLYDFQSRPKKIQKSKEYIQAMCCEVQQAVIDVLIAKTIRAAKNYRAKSIILGGGVAANEELRKQFEEKIGKEIPDSKFYIPDSQFCTDNAAMVAITSYFKFKISDLRLKNNWKNIKANANLKIE